MPITIVTSKGQVVIPSKIRKHLGVKKGTRLYVEERDNEIVFRPVTPQYLKKLAGILPTKGKLSQRLLEERAKDKAREG
jgi:AbrB family looped-hinge helix DNA binding protein